ISFRVDCLGDLPARLLRMIVNEDVALVREDCYRFVFRQLAVSGRRLLRFFISQTPQAAAVAVDDVETHLFQARFVCLLPAELNALAVLRPIDTAWRITNQARATHDAVNGEFEWLGRGGLFLRQRKPRCQQRKQANSECRFSEAFGSHLEIDPRDFRLMNLIHTSLLRSRVVSRGYRVIGSSFYPNCHDLWL